MGRRGRAATRLNLLLGLNVLWLAFFGACGFIGEFGGIGFVVSEIYILGTASLTFAGTVALGRRRPWAGRLLDLSVLLASPLALLSALLVMVGWSLLPEMIEIWGNVWWAYIGVVVASLLGLGGVVNTALLAWLRLGPADEIIWETHAASRDFENQMGMAGSETELDFGDEVAAQEQENAAVSAER